MTALFTSRMTYRHAFKKEKLKISVLLVFSSFYLMYSDELGWLSSWMWKLVFDIQIMYLLTLIRLLLKLSDRWFKRSLVIDAQLYLMEVRSLVY